MDRSMQEENEKKKEYLKSYQRAVKRERDILEEIKRLRADKMFPSVVNDGMPKGSSQSDLSDYIAILDEQIELLKKERLNKVQQYRKIESQIRKMHSEDERKVLRLRYIKGLKWDDVATEIPLKEAWDKRCDKQNLMPLHHDTHSKIEQMYKKERPVMEKKLAKMLVDFYTQTGGAV